MSEQNKPVNHYTNIRESAAVSGDAAKLFPAIGIVKVKFNISQLSALICPHLLREPFESLYKVLRIYHGSGEEQVCFDYRVTELSGELFHKRRTSHSILKAELLIFNSQNKRVCLAESDTIHSFSAKMADKSYTWNKPKKEKDWKHFFSAYTDYKGEE
ncbi:hypothetical protein LRR81_02600 [Metabacillus sp. GX 13764]|uniref:hypothetical protein n=1 Tax=Metabacillus kandeliae TaxID=2900151 RepID=UPI001E5345C6|nr:hypothetical protein [Metabacillus kandeliae]MCD7033104.1 hypothetical protein [Metabacillus kandeliae]